MEKMNDNLSDEDKKILEKLRPEERQKFQFFPSNDEDERSWIARNAWWILIILGAIVISFLR